VGDKAKTSKRGQLALLKTAASFETVQKAPQTELAGDLLKPVYDNGKILHQCTFDQVRQKAEQGLSAFASQLPL
jgi:hypothetical protein